MKEEMKKNEEEDSKKKKELVMVGGIELKQVSSVHVRSDRRCSLVSPKSPGFGLFWVL